MRFARRMDRVKGSEIRSVGKKIAASKNKDMVKMSNGLPDASLFPIEGLKEATDVIWDRRTYEALQYGPTKGEVELLELITKRMVENENLNITSENVLVTTGCQQGIALTSMAFLDEGDVVVVENPSYLDGLNACIPFECEFVGVDTDDDGMIISELKKVLDTNDRVKMIYVIPTFQNPTGKAWTESRRREFMDLVRKYDVMVLEDNPYGEIKYIDGHMPALKSLDTTDQVVYLGSFSKVLSPGLRVAWAIGEPELMEKLEVLKEGMDLQSNQFAQIQVIEYAKKYDLDDHIGSLIDVYKERCNAVIDAMKGYFPEGVTYTEPDGGMFLWVDLPEGIDTSELLDEALEAGVAYIPGFSFYCNGGGTNSMRLCFTSVSLEEIEKGIRILGGVFKKAIDRILVEEV